MMVNSWEPDKLPQSCQTIQIFWVKSKDVHSINQETTTFVLEEIWESLNGKIFQK